MRYQNWDVLIFPQRSRVPVQEFRTGCHTTVDIGGFSCEASGAFVLQLLSLSSSTPPADTLGGGV